MICKHAHPHECKNPQVIFRVASEFVEENKEKQKSKCGCPVCLPDHAQAHVYEPYVDMVTPTFEIKDEISGQ